MKRGFDLEITNGNSSALIRPLYPRQLAYSDFVHDYPDDLYWEVHEAPAENMQDTEKYWSFHLPGITDRVRLEYTVSYQNVIDQIFSVPTAGSTGYQYLITNAGKMRTWSHEIGLNVAVLQHRDYDLNLGVNFTAVDNKVVELAEGVESIMLGGFVEPQVRAQAGNNNMGGYFERFSVPNTTSIGGGLKVTF